MRNELLVILLLAGCATQPRPTPTPTPTEIQPKTVDTEAPDVGASVEHAVGVVGRAIPGWDATVVTVDSNKKVETQQITLISDPFKEVDALTVSGLGMLPNLYGGGMHPVAELDRENGELKRLYVWMRFRTPRWTYLDCHSVAALSGGERMSWDTQHEGEVASPLLYEAVVFQLTLEELERLATDDARVQVCEDRYRLKLRPKILLRQYVAALKQQIATRPVEDSPDE